MIYRYFLGIEGVKGQKIKFKKNTQLKEKSSFFEMPSFKGCSNTLFFIPEIPSSDNEKEIYLCLTNNTKLHKRVSMRKR